MTAPSRPSEERPAPAPFTDEQRKRFEEMSEAELLVYGTSVRDLLDRLDAAEQRADEAERRLAEIREAWGCRWKEQIGRRMSVGVDDDIANRIDAALAASPESVR